MNYTVSDAASGYSELIRSVMSQLDPKHHGMRFEWDLADRKSSGTAAEFLIVKANGQGEFIEPQNLSNDERAKDLLSRLTQTQCK
jgi:hypothetical protein